MKRFLALVVCTAFALPVLPDGPAFSQGMAAGGKMNMDMGGSAPAGSAEVTAGTLVISKAYAKAMLPGQPVGGAYLTITNNGKADDELVSVSSPVAGAVELHEMAMQGEVMKMRKLDKGIAIPAGKSVELSPGGLHMMFTKVKQPFKQGETVAVTLTFAKAGNVDIALPVSGLSPK